MALNTGLSILVVYAILILANGTSIKEEADIFKKFNPNLMYVTREKQLILIERTPEFFKLVKSHCVFSKISGEQYDSLFRGIFWCENFKGDERLPKNFQGAWSFKNQLDIAMMILDIQQNLDRFVPVSYKDADSNKYFYGRAIPVSKAMKVFEYVNLETKTKTHFMLENGELKPISLK